MVRSTKQNTTSKHTLATIHAVPLERRLVCITRMDKELCAKIVAT